MKDFVDAVPGSSGARLAAWLQPESRLDPNKCELEEIEEPVRFGWPTDLTVITRDQYGDAVYVPNLKIQITASPSVNGLNGNRKGKRLSQADAVACKGMAMPPRIPYQATVDEKFRYNGIAFMKVSSHCKEIHQAILICDQIIRAALPTIFFRRIAPLQSMAE